MQPFHALSNPGLFELCHVLSICVSRCGAIYFGTRLLFCVGYVGKGFVFNGLDRVMVCQPILHNLKGAGSRALNVMGQLLPGADAVALMRIVGKVAKRYSKGSFHGSPGFDCSPSKTCLFLIATKQKLTSFWLLTKRNVIDFDCSQSKTKTCLV